MNKAQFDKLYKKIADPEDRNSGLAEYVFVFFRAHCKYSCYFIKIFPLFDTNDDETINFSEFAVATTMLNKNDLDSGLELAFGL